MQGIGQAVPIPTWTYETPETVVATLRDFLAPALIGADPGDFQDIHARMHQAVRPAFSIGQPICKAAIDLACFDLVGKRRGLSAGDLLAELAPSRAPHRTARDHFELDRQLSGYGRRRGATRRGATTRLSQLQHQSWRTTVARVRFGARPQGARLRSRRLSLGRRQYRIHGGGSARGGAQARRCRGRRPRVPLPPNRIRGYQALKKQGALPILMDEGILSPVEAEEFVELGMMDGIAMKPARKMPASTPPS